MDFETVSLIILISGVVGIFSFMAGANFCIEITRKEIKEYNSIRLDGVYYYPAESGDIRNERIQYRR